MLIGDWGFYTQLRVLVPKAQLDDVSWRLNDGTIMPDAFAPAVGQRTFLLLHRRATTSFPQARRQAVELVRRTGLRTRMVARLRDLDGRPNAEIVELLPPDTTARTKPG